MFIFTLQLENKFRQEMDEHKTKLDKEYETLMQNFIKELDKLRIKHSQDLDKTVSEIYQHIGNFTYVCLQTIYSVG